VLPEITIYGGTPVKPGTPFSDPDAAARAALTGIYQTTIESGREVGGRIYRNQNGLSYSFSPPVVSSNNENVRVEDSPVPSGVVVVGTYHSHGAGASPLTWVSDEFFSPDDKFKATISRAEKPSYLLTPLGQLFKYTPVDMLAADLQTQYPKGLVARLP
jgi:Domain of unknown function (DUF4329)